MGKDKRKSHHLTYSDRLYIEKWRKQKVRVAEVAERLGVSRQTIYKELKRGEYTSLTSEWENVTAYSPDIAEAHYRENLKAKGTGLKIGNHIEMADYMERTQRGKFRFHHAGGSTEHRRLDESLSETKACLPDGR